MATPAPAARPRFARLRALSPFGPIFLKELRVASRRRRNHVLRVTYLGALLLILLMAYSAVGDYGGSGVLGEAQRQGQLGATFFSGFLYFSVIAMGVIGPVLTSTAIGAERTHKTLPVLLMTPLSAWQIVAGKLLSRMLLAGVLIGLSLPVLALVRLLGGVETWQMGAAIVLAAATGLFAASVGLWLSTIITRAYAVILAAYGVLAALYMLLPFVLIMLSRGTGGFAWMWLMGLFNPVYSAAMIQFGGVGMPRAMMVSWWSGVLTHVAGAIVLTALSAWILRRQQRREDRVDPGLVNVGYTAEPIAPEAETAVDVPPPPPAAAVAEDGRHREVGENPIRWRELRQPVFQKRWLRVVSWLATVGVLAVVYGLIGAEVGLDDEDTHVMFGILYNAVVWVLAAVISATAIAQEKEGDTWTLLLSTPLPAHKIVLGKLAGIFWRLKLLAVLVVLHFAVFAATGAITPAAAVLAIGVILGFNAFWITTGLYLSLKVNKVTVAVVVNLILGVVAYLGLILVEAAAMELLEVRRNGPFSALISPYWYLAEGIDRLSSDYFYYASSPMIRVPGVDTQVTAMGFLRVAVAVVLGHLLAAAGVAWWTISRFDRIVGRASQVGPA